MGWITKIKQERSNNRLQTKIQELEDTVNVRIVDNKLMIVIASYRENIYLSPELFKDERPEDIVKKIREYNLK